MRCKALLFLFIIAFGACKNNKSTSDKSAETAVESVKTETNDSETPAPSLTIVTPEEKTAEKQLDQAKVEVIREIQVVPGMKLSKSDAFSYGSVQIQGDSLLIAVQYSGGCKAHEWNMYTTGTYSKTFPPKIEVYLHHTSNQDFCKALLRETLIFDLKNIRYEGSKEVEIQLNDFIDFLNYQYK